MKFKTGVMILFIFLVLLLQIPIFSTLNDDAIVVYARIKETESIVAIDDNREYDILRDGKELKFDIILKFHNSSNEKKELKDVKYYIFFDKDPSEKTRENPVYPNEEGPLGEQTLEAGEEREETPISFTYRAEVGDYNIYIQVGEGYMEATKIEDLQLRVEPYPVKVHYHTEVPVPPSEKLIDIEWIRANKNIIFLLLILVVGGSMFIFRDWIEKHRGVLAIFLSFLGICFAIWMLL